MKEQQIHTTETHAKPWGFWATMGFSFIIGVFFILIQVVVLIIIAFNGPIEDLDQFMAQIEELENNGFCLAVMTIVGGIFIIPIILFFAWLRKGIPLDVYMGFKRFTLRELWVWSLILIAFIAASDLILYSSGHSIFSPFMIETYLSAGSVPLLLFALLIMAPLVEEFFIRGFLLQGLRYSWLGTGGAIIITSVIWTLMHTQYELIALIHIFITGIILGGAFIKTNSIYIPLILHFLMNLIATVELMIYLHLLT